jgi:hypothetical protein
MHPASCRMLQAGSLRSPEEDSARLRSKIRQTSKKFNASRQSRSVLPAALNKLKAARCRFYIGLPTANAAS